MKFSESITIDASAEGLFDFTQDYDQRLSWDTFLQQAELIDGASSADLGVKAYCEAHNGMGMVTEYVSFRRPKVTAIKMIKGPYMFKSFLGSWNFKEPHPGSTEVQFLHYFIFENEEAETFHKRTPWVEAFVKELYPQLESDGVEFRNYYLLSTTER